jgi:hypothetical protein
MKWRVGLEKFNFFFENLADLGKFWRLALVFKQRNPDPPSEAGSRSRGQTECRSALLLL